MSTVLRVAAVLPLIVSAAPASDWDEGPKLAELVWQSDVVLLVAYRESVPDAPGGHRSARFDIRRVIKGDYEPGQTVETQDVSADPGDLHLLTRPAGRAAWDEPFGCSEAAFDYIAKAPAPRFAGGLEVPCRTRLPYFAAFLENADEMVAEDAFREFSDATPEDLAAAQGAFEREKLREWVLSPDTLQERLSVYAVMLGLVGTEEDGTILERLAVAPVTDFRLGADGVMSGYLLLRGEPGLDLLQRLKLEARHVVGPGGHVVRNEAGQPVPTPFSETYSAMQAVRFMWWHGDGRIAPERLRAAMRTLLARPELADLVIMELARWKDWAVVERVAGLYDAEGFEHPGIKRAILRYLMAAQKDRPVSERPEEEPIVPEHAEQAERHFSTIRRKDPATVKSLRKFENPLDPSPDTDAI